MAPATSSPSYKKPATKPMARVVPVIPKHFTRKSIEKKANKNVETIVPKPADSVVGDTSSSPASRMDSPMSTRNGTGSDPSAPPSLAESQGNIGDTSAGAEAGVTVIHKGEQPVDAGESEASLGQTYEDANSVQRASDTYGDLPVTVGSSHGATAPELEQVVAPSHTAPPIPLTMTNLQDLPGQRVGVVFGGAADSSAPSPVPDYSSFSSNSYSHGPANSIFSAPQIPHIDSHSRNTSQANGIHGVMTENHFQQPPVYPTSELYHQPSVGPARYPMKSPRPMSMASNPDPSWIQYPPSFGPFHHQNGSYHTAHQYNGYPGPQFHQFSGANRMSGQFDSRMLAEPDYQSALDLKSHTESFFQNPEFADCLLRVSDDKGDTAELLAHRMILSRSPRLRKMLAAAIDTTTTTYNGREYHSIEIPATASLHDSSMFCLAVRHLYGGSVIGRHTLQTSQSPKQAMAKLLSYIAAGSYLEVNEIASAGLRLMHDFIVPENLDLALAFAKSRQQATPARPGSAISNDVLYQVQRYLIDVITSQRFTFDPIAPEAAAPRFPASLSAAPSSATPAFSHKSRPSISNPALSGMTLGSFPTTASNDRIISSALLSLPSMAFRDMVAPDHALAKRMPADAARGLVRAVVAERETRRSNAVEAWRGLPETDKRELVGLAALWTEESVEDLPVEMGVVRVGLRDVRPQL